MTPRNRIQRGERWTPVTDHQRRPAPAAKVWGGTLHQSLWTRGRGVRFHGASQPSICYVMWGSFSMRGEKERAGRGGVGGGGGGEGKEEPPSEKPRSRTREEGPTGKGLPRVREPS